MNKFILTALMLVLLQSPALADDKSLLPLVVGNTWYYKGVVSVAKSNQLVDLAKSVPMFEKRMITAKEKINNVDVFVMETYNGFKQEELQLASRQYIAESNNEIKVYKTILYNNKGQPYEQVFPTPAIMIKSMAMIGEKWFLLPDKRESVVYSGKEQVNVTAGSFNAYIFNVQRKDEAISYFINQAYAPGVGLVREMTIEKSGTIVTIAVELVKFSK